MIVSREATTAHSCRRQLAEREKIEYPAAKRRQQSNLLPPLLENRILRNSAFTR
jgi:hypothetical protein